MEGAAQEARLDQPMERNDVQHDSFLIRGDQKSAAGCPQAWGGGALAQLNPPSGPYTIQLKLIPRFGSD